jgi:hypothetical protein
LTAQPAASALDRRGKDSYRTASIGVGGSCAGESILCEEAEDDAHARTGVAGGVSGFGFLRLLLVGGQNVSQLP